MYFQSETEMLVFAFLGGLVVGLLIGLVPLLVGYIKGHSRDGAAGLLVCGIFGAIGGWILAGIIAIISTIYIASKPSAPTEPERVPCPHCAEPIVKGAKVCRFCGGSLEAG